MRFMTPEERADDPLIKLGRLNALIRCAICADDTTVNVETLFGDDDKGIWQLLEVAERMSQELQRDVERMQRRLKEGIYKREDAEQAKEA